MSLMVSSIVTVAANMEIGRLANGREVMYFAKQLHHRR
jgi:hypothetical protein